MLAIIGAPAAELRALDRSKVFSLTGPDMLFLRRRAVFVILALINACGGEQSIRRFTPPDADARARDYINQFARGQVDSAIARLVPSLRTAESSVELRRIADLLRNERFDTVRVIGAQTNTINGVRHVNLTYELHSSSSWILANVATVDTTDSWLVEGVSARSIEQPLEIAAQFSLAGKSLLHYAWLGLTIVCAALSLASAVFLATRRAMPKRWRWVVLSLLGVCAFQLNWATGGINVAPLQVLLGSAAFMRAAPAAPWILSFALPVGAIMGLNRYRRWRSLTVPAEESPLPTRQAAV